MKTIAVLIYDVTIEYHVQVIDGITSYFKDKPDVSLCVVPINAAHASGSNYGYQYWTLLELVKTKSFDGTIVVTNSFCEYMTMKSLEEELEPLAMKPMVSISVPLDYPSCRYTYISSEKPYKQIVEHLVKKHDRKRIAFFSAELNGSLEAEERLLSYKAALKANGLEYDEDLVFPGDFTPRTTYEYLKKHFTSKESLTFDALLCSNDYMAGGAFDAFRELNIKVPEDVIVVGFDDGDVAKAATPAITTVNQNVPGLSAAAAEMLYHAINGDNVPHSKKIDCIPVYRQSCGCVPMDVHTHSWFDEAGSYHNVETTNVNLNLFGNPLNDLLSIHSLLDMTETLSDVNEYFTNLIANLKSSFIPYCAICLYDEEFNLGPDDSFSLPDKARLMMYYDEQNKLEQNFFKEDGIPFNPQESLLPPLVRELGPGNFQIIPIFIRNLNYGYLIFQIPNPKYTINAIYMKILVNAFVHSYEFTRNMSHSQKLEALTEELSKESRTDELTGIFNRRGFMEYGQRMLDLSIATGAKGSVFFFDMDGLKKINDTWGHKMGDTAIQTLAEVLKEVFHKSDIVGRLSGDEFAVIAPGFDKKNAQILRNRIEDICVSLSQSRKLPLNISTSFGIATYSADKAKLNQLLMQADKELYKEKKIKHGR